jgi:hypothetical protein
MSETNGVVTGYIPDGYEKEGVIKSVPGLYPEVRFTYRPMLGHECSELWQRQGKFPDNAKARDLILSKIIIAHVQEWDVKRSGDKGLVDCERTPDAFTRLVPALRTRLAQIVMGNEPDDSAPQAEPAKSDWEREIEAEAKGERIELVESGN